MELFDTMAEQSSLRVLNIGGNSLVSGLGLKAFSTFVHWFNHLQNTLTQHLSVGAASLARAVSRLSEVRLESAYLRRLQLAALFDTLQLCKEISLTRVELHCNNLAEVSYFIYFYLK